MQVYAFQKIKNFGKIQKPNYLDFNLNFAELGAKPTFIFEKF